MSAPIIPTFYHALIDFNALDEQQLPFKIGQIRVTNFSQGYLKLCPFLLSDRFRSKLMESINDLLSPFQSVDTPECFYVMPRLKSIQRRKRERFAQSNFLPGSKITTLFKNFNFNDLVQVTMKKGEQGFISVATISLYIFKMIIPNPAHIGRTLNFVWEEKFLPFHVNEDGSQVVSIPSYIEPDSFNDFASFARSLTLNNQLRDSTGITSILHGIPTNSDYLHLYHPVTLNSQSVRLFPTPMLQGILQPKKDKSQGSESFKAKRNRRRNRASPVKSNSSSPQKADKNPPCTSSQATVNHGTAQEPQVALEDHAINQSLLTLPAPDQINSYVSSRQSVISNEDTDEAFLQSLGVSELLQTRTHIINKSRFHLQQIEHHLPLYKLHYSSYEKCLAMVAALGVIIDGRQEDPLKITSSTQSPSTSTSIPGTNSASLNLINYPSVHTLFKLPASTSATFVPASVQQYQNVPDQSLATTATATTATATTATATNVSNVTTFVPVITQSATSIQKNDQGMDIELNQQAQSQHKSISQHVNATDPMDDLEYPEDLHFDTNYNSDFQLVKDQPFQSDQSRGDNQPNDQEIIDK